MHVSIFPIFPVYTRFHLYVFFFICTCFLYHMLPLPHVSIITCFHYHMFPFAFIHLYAHIYASIRFSITPFLYPSVCLSNPFFSLYPLFFSLYLFFLSIFFSLSIFSLCFFSLSIFTIVCHMHTFSPRLSVYAFTAFLCFAIFPFSNLNI